MKPKWVIVMAALLAGTGAAHAGFVELGISNDAADLVGGFDIGSDDAALFIGGRYLYVDDDDGDTKLPALIVAFSGRSGADEEITFLAGLQGYSGEARDQDVEGVALGGSMEWKPDNWNGFFVGGLIFWAPSILSFGNTDNISEWNVRAGYAVNDHFSVFAEYTSLEFDTEDADNIEAHKGGTIGFKFGF